MVGHPERPPGSGPDFPPWATQLTFLNHGDLILATRPKKFCLAALFVSGLWCASARASAPRPSTESGEANVLQAVIRFSPDRVEVRQLDEPALERIVGFLMKHPDARIEIQGHTDPYGTGEYELALGDKYAGSVRQWLRNRGVPLAQLETKSYGKDSPSSTARTEACPEERPM